MELVSLIYTERTMNYVLYDTKRETTGELSLPTR